MEFRTAPFAEERDLLERTERIEVEIREKAGREEKEARERLNQIRSEQHDLIREAERLKNEAEKNAEDIRNAKEFKKKKVWLEKEYHELVMRADYERSGIDILQEGFIPIPASIPGAFGVRKDMELNLEHGVLLG